MRFDHVASIVVNANHGIGLSAMITVAQRAAIPLSKTLCEESSREPAQVFR
jgi:hypothetical protein